jgi:hypothetical protein
MADLVRNFLKPPSSVTRRSFESAGHRRAETFRARLVAKHDLWSVRRRGGRRQVLDLSLEQTVNALGIASLHSGGMITGGNEGATARHLAFGHAAERRARATGGGGGLYRSEARTEDPRGFCLTLCNEPNWDYLQSFDSFFCRKSRSNPILARANLHAGVEALLKIWANFVDAVRDRGN